MIRFDLSLLPENAVIESAKLSIYRTGFIGEEKWETQYDHSGRYFASKVNEEWDETSWPKHKFIIYPNKISKHVEFDSVFIGKSQEYVQWSSPKTGWYSIDVLPIFQKYTLDNISKTGFILYAKNKIPFNSSGGKGTFASIYATSKSNRPKLTITYYIENVGTMTKDVNLKNKTTIIRNDLNILSFTCPEKVESISLFSLNGKHVLDIGTVDSKQASIPLGNLSKGSYIYSIKVEKSAFRINGKFVIP